MFYLFIPIALGELQRGRSAGHWQTVNLVTRQRISLRNPNAVRPRWIRFTGWRTLSSRTSALRLLKGGAELSIRLAIRPNITFYSFITRSQRPPDNIIW